MPPVKRIQGSKNSRTRSAFGFPKNGATGPDQEGGVMCIEKLSIIFLAAPEGGGVLRFGRFGGTPLGGSARAKEGYSTLTFSF